MIKKYIVPIGGEDRISLLPDPLLSKILVNLRTKDVVKTSLLSTRWRSVWLWVPGLDLDDNEFPDYASFVNFVDKFVKLSIDQSPFEKLKLTSRREETFPLAIDFPVNFLNRISTVRDMTICEKTLEVIHQYWKLEPSPQFCNMSQLHAKFSAANLKMFPDLLESCPNIKSLVLELNGSTKKKLEQLITFSSVPWCLLSSLENLEMKNPIRRIGVEMELIRYFLEHSTVLKKLTLRLEGCKMKKKSMLIELLSFRRCSSVCEVVVV